MNNIAPLPWMAGHNVLRDGRGNSIASGGNNRVVKGEALWSSLEHAAKCVNMHDELVAALRRALDAGIGSDGKHPSAADEARAVLEEVAAA